MLLFLILYLVSELPHLQVSMQECSFLLRDQLLKVAYKCKWSCLIIFEIPAVAQVATLLLALYICYPLHLIIEYENTIG